MIQRGSELDAIQVADRLDVHSETVKRWHREGKLKAEIRNGKLYIKERDLRSFLLERRDTPKNFLRLFTSSKKFEEKIVKRVEKFFGDEPGCIIALLPDGLPYALSLYFGLPLDKDINFILLSEEQLYEPSQIEGRKVLIVDNDTHTGKSLKVVKEALAGLNTKGIKTAVYDDSAGCADFAVRVQNYEEHLNSLKRALKQFRL